MNDDAIRSRLIASILGKRRDEAQRKLIDAFAEPLEFQPIADLMISASAWKHVSALGIAPQVVFAHPDLLQAHPTTSLYYRGLALLSRKRLAHEAAPVTSWEEGNLKAPVKPDHAKKVACFCNAVVSSIIEGSSDWTLDNGYRNILATMGITLDGMFRNRVGEVAENLVKNRIVSWLESKGLIAQDVQEYRKYPLVGGIVMRYASEPDIDFVRDEQLIATIEIKGGRDRAGALERLGAMTKSFAETPPGCVNFLIAGVVTPEMQVRLDAMGNVKVYLLDDVAADGEKWDQFMNEVFHYTVRVI